MMENRLQRRGKAMGEPAPALRCDSPGWNGSADREALAAAARSRDIGIAEREGGIETLLFEVDLGAVDQRQAVGIDHDANAVVVDTWSFAAMASATSTT
jgi:hypothetical protein